MDISNPHNSLLRANLEAKAKQISAVEAVLEAGPQLFLQIYIILITGNIGKVNASAAFESIR